MSIWNEETERILSDMFHDGKSGEDIAARLSELTGKKVSRNTVIGKRHRMGLVHSVPSDPGKAKRKPRKRTATPDGAATKRLRTGPPQSKHVKRRRKRSAPIPEHKGIAFDDLTAGVCRWPEGEGDEMSFCGCKATHGPYCEAHHRIGHAGTYAPSEDADEGAESVRRAA